MCCKLQRPSLNLSQYTGVYWLKWIHCTAVAAPQPGLLLLCLMTT